MAANGLPQRAMAMPHDAIAQDGSTVSAAVNAVMAGPNSNECSSVMPSVNCSCAVGVQLVSKLTVPSFSPPTC